MILCPLPVQAGEKDEIYMGLYVLGSLPQNRNAVLLGTEIPSTKLNSAAGAGLKVGLFPAVTRRMIGLEIEYFGNGGHITLPAINNNPSVSGTSDFIVLNTMASLVLTYPGDSLRPYIGAGIGLSEGILTNMNIPGRADRGWQETAYAFGYQFIAGSQYGLTGRTFVFGEYKYFGSDYHWKGLSLDLRTHYVLAGVGLRF